MATKGREYSTKVKLSVLQSVDFLTMIFFFSPLVAVSKYTRSSATVTAHAAFSIASKLKEAC